MDAWTQPNEPTTEINKICYSFSQRKILLSYPEARYIEQGQYRLLEQ